eukprot:CAMPEP_0183795990 /NCGR_PEP_ID=MMETSP0803_2-20130417/6834_1 /TAXON_ID=195967 /ORGANISM="Crustomastix stigmata, Strain CCMP3273" /LENGTH=181 /DNA_ID=CAMNT_0026040563 /DNA_START=460 /DNA_END=1002 /DNA_ORIENTATION=+
MTEKHMVLKASTSLRTMPTFIKIDDMEMVNKQLFDVENVQRKIEEGKRRSGILSIEYIVEELLFAEDGNTYPPPCYKIFLLGGHALKIFYFGSKFQQSGKIDVACVDCAHNPCDLSWLKTNLGNFNTECSFPTKPLCWDELLQTALQIGTSIERFVLLKFYATDRGAVFGGISHDFDEWAW